MTTAIDLASHDGLDEGERRQLRQSIRDRAVALDRGETDTREDIALLGSLDLIAVDLGAETLHRIVTVIEDVAAESLSAGFSLWAQRIALEFISRGQPAVREKFAAGLQTGATVGVTAMAPALKQLAGLGNVPLVATSVDGGFEVSGPIHWASNLFEGALIVLPARVAAQDGGCVLAVESSAPGVRVAPAHRLLALNATASTSLTLDRVFVPSDHLISRDLLGCVSRLRPTFLLLQSAFCSGLARTAVNESAPLLRGLGEQFAEDHARLAAEHASLSQRLRRYADGDEQVPDRELIRLRLDGARLAVAATYLEVTLRGGAGYAVGSATNRRFREAAFLPVQSPSEGQLKWELARSA